MGNNGSKIRSCAYGPWLVGAWEKPNLDCDKTWRPEVCTPTPRAMGVVEVFDFGPSLLLMLGTLYA